MLCHVKLTEKYVKQVTTVQVIDDYQFLMKMYKCKNCLVE